MLSSLAAPLFQTKQILLSPVYMASSNWQAMTTLPKLQKDNALRVWQVTGEEEGGCVMQDDKCLYDYNVQNRVDAFVKASEELASVTYGDDILIPFGSDFQWVSAHQYYKNVDKLIHYINKDGRINAFYSTPAEYVAVKHQYNHSWPLKTDDFFPYADCPVCYWTGTCCAVLRCAALRCAVSRHGNLALHDEVFALCTTQGRISKMVQQSAGRLLVSFAAEICFYSADQ